MLRVLLLALVACVSTAPMRLQENHILPEKNTNPSTAPVDTDPWPEGSSHSSSLLPSGKSPELLSSLLEKEKVGIVPATSPAPGDDAITSGCGDEGCEKEGGDEAIESTPIPFKMPEDAEGEGGGQGEEGKGGLNVTYVYDDEGDDATEPVLEKEKESISPLTSPAPGEDASTGCGDEGCKEDDATEPVLEKEKEGIGPLTSPAPGEDASTGCGDEGCKQGSGDNIGGEEGSGDATESAFKKEKEGISPATSPAPGDDAVTTGCGDEGCEKGSGDKYFLPITPPALKSESEVPPLTSPAPGDDALSACGEEGCR